MSPMLTEITLPPGSSYENDISLTNTGDEPIVIETQVVGFIAPEGIPQLIDPIIDDYTYSGRELLTITPIEQTIEPGETVLFHYHVAMPEDLDPYGGRYAAVIFRVKPAATTAQVVVAAQVASLFLLNPAGEVASHLSMDQIGIYQPKNDPQNVVLTARITNDGNLHISRDQIWGMIHVMDEDGYLIDSFEVDTHAMLPDNSYTHKEIWAAPGYLPSGTYQFHLTVLIFEPLGTEPQCYFLTLPVELQF